MGGTRFMPASTLTKRSGVLQGVTAYRALTTKRLRQDLRRFVARKPLSYLFFKNVSRPKREGLADLQFKLLSVGSQGDPNRMIYTNEGGGNERYHLYVGQLAYPRASPYTRRSQNGVTGGEAALTRRALRHRQQVHASRVARHPTGAIGHSKGSVY